MIMLKDEKIRKLCNAIESHGVDGSEELNRIVRSASYSLVKSYYYNEWKIIVGGRGKQSERRSWKYGLDQSVCSLVCTVSKIESLDIEYQWLLPNNRQACNVGAFTTILSLLS